MIARHRHPTNGRLILTQKSYFFAFNQIQFIFERISQLICDDLHQDFVLKNGPGEWESIRLKMSHSEYRGKRVLNKTELQIVELLLQGLSNREIAAELDISPEAVKIQMKNILSKFVSVRSGISIEVVLSELPRAEDEPDPPS
jgi:DNA-binding CsgD family transcriptional regulator